MICRIIIYVEVNFTWAGLLLYKLISHAFTYFVVVIIFLIYVQFSPLPPAYPAVPKSMLIIMLTFNCFIKCHWHEITNTLTSFSYMFISCSICIPPPWNFRTLSARHGCTCSWKMACFCHKMKTVNDHQGLAEHGSMV